MCDVNVEYVRHLEVMRSATPHTGVEPSVGPKTVVMGFTLTGI